MKNILLAAVAAVAFAGSASAQTSVNIPLSGTLAKACTISAFLNGPFDALNMTSTTTQGAESLTTNCNYSAGASGNLVTLTSTNAGKLKSAGGQEVDYLFSVSGGVLPETALTAPVVITFGAGAPANTNFTRSMSVRLATAATIAGTYSDTVTATVTPN